MSNDSRPSRARSNSVGRNGKSKVGGTLLGYGINPFSGAPTSVLYEQMVENGRARQQHRMVDALAKVGLRAETTFLEVAVRGCEQFDKFRVSYVRLGNAPMTTASIDDGSSSAAAARALTCCSDMVMPTQSDSMLCVFVNQRRYENRLLPLDLNNRQIFILFILFLVGTALCVIPLVGNDVVWQMGARVFGWQSFLASFLFPS